MTPRALDGASAQHTGNRHDGQHHTIVVVAIPRKRGWRMPRPRAPSGSNQTLGTGRARSQKGGKRAYTGRPGKDRSARQNRRSIASASPPNKSRHIRVRARCKGAKRLRAADCSRRNPLALGGAGRKAGDVVVHQERIDDDGRRGGQIRSRP